MGLLDLKKLTCHRDKALYRYLGWNLTHPLAEKPYVFKYRGPLTTLDAEILLRQMAYRSGVMI